MHNKMLLGNDHWVPTSSFFKNKIPKWRPAIKIFRVPKHYKLHRNADGNRCVKLNVQLETQAQLKFFLRLQLVIIFNNLRQKYYKILGGTYVSVAGHQRDLSWCRGRDALTAGGGEGGSYQCACLGPPAGSILELWCCGWDALVASKGGRVGVWRL